MHALVPAAHARGTGDFHTAVSTGFTLKREVTMIKKIVVFSVLAGLLATTVVFARESAPPQEQQQEVRTASFGRALLMYVPNRVFDVFDIVRIRIRLGPGIAAGARATQGIEAFFGAYRTFWIGLHGPRTEPKVPRIMGLEGRQGAKAILFGEVDDTNISPNYQFDEIGADAQAAVAGVSVGVSIAEIFDLLLGFLFIDISGDDF
jgi:hypothetical protein